MLDKNSIHVRCYTDASFSPHGNLSFQIGFLILLFDASYKCHILEYQGRLSGRDVGSALASKVFAFIEAFDAAFMMSADLKCTHGEAFDLLMFTDYIQLLDALSREKRMEAYHLMIDILTAH